MPIHFKCFELGQKIGIILDGAVMHDNLYTCASHRNVCSDCFSSSFQCKKFILHVVKNVSFMK